jgi:imidazolonepropionase-like amidohydrolase
MNNKGILALSGVGLIDGINKDLQTDMTIIIHNGRITEIGKKDDISIPVNAKVMNLSGKVVMPGMIDSHLHLTQSGVDDYMKPFSERMTIKLKRNAYLNLKSGVTTVRNMPGGGGDCVLKFRDNIEEGKVLGPRILTCGPALSASFGYFSLKMFIPVNDFMRAIISHVMGANGLSIDVDTEEEARETVRKLKEKGVDFIKTVSPGANMPYVEREPEFREEALRLGVKPETIDASMKPEILEAIVQEAHKEGLKVVVHNICWPEGFKKAVIAGADSMEHVPFGILDDETFEKMKENDVFWTPTVYSYYNWKNLIDHPDEYDKPEIKELIPEPFHTLGKRTLAKVREGINNGTNPFWTRFYNEVDRIKEEYFPANLKIAREYGIKIAAGVDAGASGAGYVPHGLLYKELELFVHFGMDEFEAIQTATINGAELLGMSKDLGSIEIGKIGDIIVLDANPLENISNLESIHCVIKEGEKVI